MHKLKLSARIFAGLIIYEVAELRQDVGANLHHHLMEGGGGEDIAHLVGRILLDGDVWLLLSKACDDLGDSEPNIFTHVVACELNQLDDHVEVPVEVLSKLLSQDGDLEDHLLLQLIVVLLQVVKQLIDHFTSRFLVA